MCAQHLRTSAIPAGPSVLSQWVHVLNIFLHSNLSLTVIEYSITLFPGFLSVYETFTQQWNSCRSLSAKSMISCAKYFSILSLITDFDRVFYHSLPWISLCVCNIYTPIGLKPALEVKKQQKLDIVRAAPPLALLFLSLGNMTQCTRNKDTNLVEQKNHLYQLICVFI